jgi:3-hydroxybutyryl-CoA dehydratase
VKWSLPFDELAVGESFTTRGRTITEADVVGFAALTGDWHPQHSDAAWAAGSAFGGRIAHGMLLVSFAVGLVPLDPDRVVALRRISDVVFKRPVRLGETIRVHGALASLRELDERTGLVTWNWRIVNQDDRLACRTTIEVLWRRGVPDANPERTATEDGFVPLPL